VKILTEKSTRKSLTGLISLQGPRVSVSHVLCDNFFYHGKISLSLLPYLFAWHKVYPIEILGKFMLKYFSHLWFFFFLKNISTLKKIMIV